MAAHSIRCVIRKFNLIYIKINSLFITIPVKIILLTGYGICHMKCCVSGKIGNHIRRFFCKCAYNIHIQIFCLTGITVRCCYSICHTRRFKIISKFGSLVFICQASYRYSIAYGITFRLIDFIRKSAYILILRKVINSNRHKRTYTIRNYL